MKSRIMKLTCCMMLVFSLIFEGIIIKIHAESNDVKNSYKEKVTICFDDMSSEELEAATIDSSTYDICVFIKLCYSAEDYGKTEKMAAKKQKSKLKEFHTNKNKSLLKNVDFDNITISEYAPYAEIRFDSLLDYQAREKDIYKLAKSSSIVSVTVSIVSFEEHSVRDEIECEIDYPYLNAYADVGITSTAYNGSGIRVGMYEQGYVNTTNPNFSNSTVSVSPEGYSRPHATTVGSFICGVNGVASGVSLYSGSSAGMGMIGCLEWLITQDVDIINMSAPLVGMEYYSANSEYLDYIISRYHIFVVKSVGNDALAEKMMDSGALSANALVVSASNANQKIYYESSFGTGNVTAGLVKPDLTAPGEKITGFSNPYSIEPLSGTSFSTPIVTGIAARLMDEFPVLIDNPQLLKAVLLESCVPLTGQATGHDTYAGAGLVNYSNARAIMSEGRYLSLSKNITESENLATANVVVPAGGTLRIRLSGEIPGSNALEYLNGKTVTVSKYLITLYNSSKTTTYASKLITENTGFFYYTNSSSEDRHISIVITTQTDNYVGVDQDIAIAFNMERDCHVYETTAAFSSTKHYVYCDCGAYVIENHIYSNDGQCLGCGFSDSTYNITDHVHIHDEDYVSYSEEEHRAYCSCGAYVMEEHDYSNSVCTECGYTSGTEMLENDHMHTWGTIVYTSGSVHTISCSCGASVSEAHFFHDYTAIDEICHVVYCACGAITEEHTYNSEGVCYCGMTQ